MTKIATVIGARPQFVKAAPVSRIFRASPGCSEVLIHTGQHYDPGLSQIFFDELKIPKPDYHLGVGSGSHGVQTGEMMRRLEALLVDINPDWVLLYGDTNSTLAGALAAAKIPLPIVHVEAGLRSFDRNMPEEINRILTDHCSEILFAPTETAVVNLIREGLPRSRIALVGDVMYDSALWFIDQARERSHILSQLELTSGQYILATVHRAANTNNLDRLQAIVDGLQVVADRIPVVFPVHPRTKSRLTNLPSPLSHDALHLIEPVSYFDMTILESSAALIITDSGGVQKEAFFHQVPCITLREETEWVELLELGWNQLLPPVSAKAIASAILETLSSERPPYPSNGNLPYGDGKAAEKIRDKLLEWRVHT